jgi:hypothetical protein
LPQDVICDTDLVAPPGHVSGQIRAPVGDINADADFGLLLGRRDGSLRRIGAGKYQAGIKATRKELAFRFKARPFWAACRTSFPLTWFERFWSSNKRARN